ncbi:hypothetical protein SAMN05216174_1011072 [Actinokineospora iranica]|uniref:PLL-like beta propeller domain-containing protein n=1 Tax=Actinokineospora iranica TaxID=1271860 RepID=A0A1G6KSH5_9PSEU|nr:hypothetical protein SAMN05216174_1011072 [Actinokineospora iranica]
MRLRITRRVRSRAARPVSALLAVVLGLAGLTVAAAPTATAESAVDGPITRAEILSRAEFWVDQNVPYDMGGKHPDPQGKFYRTDCSGFVSMALHLSWSPNTVSLPDFLDPIGWEDLRPGDVVGTLGAGTGGDAGHVVLFTGWANAGHTRFSTMEEMGGAGAVRYERPINYTTSGGQFTAKPYRYKKVIDAAPSVGAFPAESGRVVSARSADGRLEVFAAGADGVHHAWQTQVNGGWSHWEFAGGPRGAELAIAPNADGRLELLAINGDIFQHMYQTGPSGGWSGWSDFGGGGRDIAAGANADGRIEVFASGPVGVFHRYQTAVNGGWSGWEPTGGGPAFARLEMEKARDGRLEVFALNGDVFEHQYQTGVNGGWSAWENFGGGGHDLTVDHNADGRVEVFASGPVGVFHRYQTNPTSWSGWERTGGPANAQLTSERTADGRVEVFAINGEVAQHAWQTGINAPYSDWADFGAGGAEITAATNADGRLEVFATSGAGVFHRWQNGFATWSDWFWVSGTAGPAVQ